MSTVVIGAGVIGLSTAFELTQRDEDVVVVDAGELGAQASAGNAGWNTPFLSTPRAAPGAFTDAMSNFFRPEGAAKMRPQIEPGFVAWSLGFLRASTAKRNALSTSALQKLSAQTNDSFDALHDRGVQFDEYRAGLAVVFKQSSGLDVYRALAQRMRQVGYVGETTVYEGKAVQDFDPAISNSVAAVMHLESERHVRPESLTAGLAESIREAGSEVIEHDPVTRIDSRGDRWQVFLASGRVLLADRVVVAAGFHSRDLLKPLGVRIPVEAAKGVSATMLGEGTVPTHPLKLYEDMVACSPFGSALRLSGTFDIGVRDSKINKKRLDMVIRQGLQYLEDWRPTEVEIEWAGHRPTSADDLPIIGPVPNKRGLYVATGHGTLGVTLGPLTGALVADELLDGTKHPELAPFRLTRFSRFA